MVKIDELITTIYEDEAVDLPGTLTKEQKSRIEERVLGAIRGKADETGEKVISVPAGGRKRRNYFVYLIAAVLLLAFGLTTVGASNPDWDVEIIRMMGLDNADTLQLEGGEVEINKTVTQIGTEYLDGVEEKKTVSIMAATSVGDKNSAYIHVTTDYKLPEGFNEETDYIMPDIYSIDVYEKKNSVENQMGSTGMYINDNGYLGYMFEISNCENLNKSYVTIELGDFYWYHDLGMHEEWQVPEKEEELLLEGRWTLQWKFEYKSNAKISRMFKKVVIDEIPYYITKIELTPISVHMEGFRMPQYRQEEYAHFDLEEIRYEDGTVLSTEGYSAGGCRDGIWIDTFIGMKELGEPLDTKKIKSVVVEGTEIAVR